MNKIGTRKVLTLMLLLSMFSFMGCGSESKDEKATKKILSSLQEKYGEEFVLDSIGGGYGTMNNNTLKAVVRPKSDETIKVPVEITKDLKKVYDKYLNQAVAKNEQDSIQGIAERFWNNCKAVIVNDTKLTYPEDSNTKMSYAEFLELYPMNTQLVFIYINSEDFMDSQGNINQEAEFKKYMDFAEALAENKYVSSHVALRYLTPKAFDQLDEAKKSDDTIDTYFSDEEKKTGVVNHVTMVGFRIGTDGKVEETKEKILGYFETWKDKRLKSLEQRGGS